MVLTKDELLATLNHEVQVFLHLASKVDPTLLDYRPTPKQRSMIELLQYMTIMGPIHARGAAAGAFTMDGWRAAWNTGEATARTLTLDQIKASIGTQHALFAELLGPLSDADMREDIEMFGQKAPRGVWFVRLVVSHLPAYRMQLFLYLKSCGRDELNTMNLWVGMDTPSR